MKLLMENWRKFIGEANESKISSVWGTSDDLLTDRNMKSLLDGTYEIVGPFEGVHITPDAGERNKYTGDRADLKKKYDYYLVQDKYGDNVFQSPDRFGPRPNRFGKKEWAEEAVRKTIARYKDQQEHRVDTGAYVGPEDDYNLERLTPEQLQKLAVKVEGYKKFIYSAPIRLILKAFGQKPRSVEKQVIEFVVKDALGILKTNDGSGEFMGVDTMSLSPAAIPVLAALLPIFIIVAGYDISEEEKIRASDWSTFEASKAIYFWAPKAGFLSPVTLIKSAVKFATAWASGDHLGAMEEVKKALGQEAVEAFKQVEAAREETQEETEEDLEELPANRDDEKTSNREKLLGVLKALEKLEDKEGS